MLIDTHCHLNFHQYSDDLDAIISRAQEAGVNRVIIPAVDIQTSHEAITLANKYTGIYVAVGVHPNSTVDFDDKTLQEIEKLSNHPKVIAIGEIGLDYYWDKSPKDTQHRAFQAQLDLASTLELPVIIHNREASEDTINILEAWAETLPDSLKDRAGVLHSVSAPADIAQRAVESGFYLGFTGPITFKKAEELRQVARQTPTNRILAETDGPFLTPHPYRGKRNEPAYIPYIVERLASLHQITSEDIGRTTTENAERLFHLPQS